VIEKGLAIGEGALTVSSFWHRDNSQNIITTLISNEIKIGSCLSFKSRLSIFAFFFL